MTQLCGRAVRGFVARELERICSMRRTCERSILTPPPSCAKPKTRKKSTTTGENRSSGSWICQEVSVFVSQAGREPSSFLANHDEISAPGFGLGRQLPNSVKEKGNQSIGAPSIDQPFVRSLLAKITQTPMYTCCSQQTNYCLPNSLKLLTLLLWASTICLSLRYFRTDQDTQLSH